ncbi:MAG: hypothetical protein RL020_323 [Pseudomonadota bacterium]|jgi:uncharacterized repeat protein (TIGR03837 family)
MALLSADIFCKVVDNYGDIGVGWRLARQLADEQDFKVRLWVDNLASLARIGSDINAQADRQIVRDIEVRHWIAPFPEITPAEVVIETFGCHVPENYVIAMSRQARVPVWINLEYLSAETWVDSHHGLPSPHSRLPLTKYFYFPGFSAKTGGLLREKSLLQTRDAFQQDENAQAGLWNKLGVGPRAKNELRMSLFCYENPALPALVQTWANGTQPITCLVPEGVAAESLAIFFQTEKKFTRGQLTLQTIPFTDQDDYDKLLWACDINFVRGEDSLVRAQWAAKPFVWHIYPQKENAHWLKLDAFMDVYSDTLSPDLAEATRHFSRAFNAGSGAAEAWPAFAQHVAVLQQHNRRWAAQLAASPGLANGLADFCRKLIK